MSRKPAKIEPAVMTMAFDTGSVGPGASIDFIIDVSQCACLLNRRFYRQGLIWALNGFKVLSRPDILGGSILGQVAVTKLPQTWVMGNSWVKGYSVWQRMISESLSETESIRPRFLDFKIFADSDHHTLGVGANLLPVSIGNFATPGEWESSKIIHPLGVGAVEGAVVQDEIIACGASYPGPSPASGFNAVSLIEGYAASRLLPNIADPNIPGDADDTDNFTPENWMAAVFNEGTEQTHEVINDLSTENNIAPYPFENDGTALDTMYPGGANQLSGLQIHDLSDISNTTIGATTRLKGGLFPCGLVKMTFANTSDVSVSHTLLVDLVPGPHRGYLAEPMRDM